MVFGPLEGDNLTALTEGGGFTTYRETGIDATPQLTDWRTAEDVRLLRRLGAYDRDRAEEGHGGRVGHELGQYRHDGENYH